MVTVDQLGQAYAVSAVAGSAFLIFSVLAGRFGHAHGAARGHAVRGFGRIGARAGGHTGSHGAGRAGGHAGSHTGSHGGRAGARAASHSGSHTSGRAGARGSARGVSRAGRSGQYSAHESGGQEMLSAQQAGPAAAASSHFFKPAPVDLRATAKEEWAMRLFMLLNPFYISVFLAFFGLTGLLCLSSNKTLGIMSLLPAIFAGIVVNWLFQIALQWMFEKLESVAPIGTADLIGHAAVISVPISGARVGEITYVVHAKRHTFPAKSLNSSEEFKKGSQVVISDIRDSTAYVEPWTDSFDPGLKDTLPAFNSADNSSNQDTPGNDASGTNV